MEKKNTKKNTEGKKNVSNKKVKDKKTPILDGHKEYCI
jgi:hypothetical protein